jgi:uncharacterized protein
VNPSSGPEPASDERVATTLAAALRDAGLPVGTGQVITFQRATRLLGDGPDERYWAGRTTLVSDPRHLAVYDRVFRALHPDVPSEDAPIRSPTDLAPALDAASDRPAVAGTADAPAVAGAVASERERLRHRRFDRATPEELAAISHLLQRLEVAVPHRTARRTRPGPRGELDLPRTLERALATDGELVGRAWRTRRRQPRRLVVLLDVSGSMAPYARALLRFGVAARRSADRAAARRVEVFAFGTRLTRLSDDLAARDPDAAIVAAARRVVDWDGGTRIGASVDELVRTWGRRGVLRGSVVVVCSDGLERGDPALLAGAVARLRRHAHRLVWVNPLAGDPRYEPSQRGMAAALPHVDVLLPGHDLASLESLGAVLADLR